MYGRRAFDDRLPQSAARRDAWVRLIGNDGHHLLATICTAGTPEWLAQLPALRMLRRVWVQQFCVGDDGARWRTEHDGMPPARLFISSPYDVDAHYARKRSRIWTGYKAHLSETCDDGLPWIITHVHTTSGPVADGDVTMPIHHTLRSKGLLPTQHIVDTGYVDAGLFVAARREFDIDLVGPARRDLRRQSQAGRGFAADSFTVDWELQRVTCPMDIRSSGWTPALDNRGTAVIKVKFSTRDCRSCASHVDCAGPTATRRLMTLRTRDEYIALRSARQRQDTPDFLRLYALRAGVEATMSQAVRGFGLRRSRYLGQAKTHLQHVATPAAINLSRLVHWISDKPLAPTRRSHFFRLVHA
jgi:transposase